MDFNWIGWIWCDETWWQASKGKTLGECAKALSKAVDEAKMQDIDTIMTGGHAPVGPPQWLDY